MKEEDLQKLLKTQLMNMYHEGFDDALKMMKQMVEITKIARKEINYDTVIDLINMTQKEAKNNRV